MKNIHLSSLNLYIESLIWRASGFINIYRGKLFFLNLPRNRKRSLLKHLRNLLRIPLVFASPFVPPCFKLYSFSSLHVLYHSQAFYDPISYWFSFFLSHSEEQVCIYNLNRNLLVCSPTCYQKVDFHFIYDVYSLYEVYSQAFSIGATYINGFKCIMMS